MQPVPAAAALARQTLQPGASLPPAALQRDPRPRAVSAAASRARRTPLSGASSLPAALQRTPHLQPVLAAANWMPQPGASLPPAALQRAPHPLATSAAASRARLRRGVGLKAERGGRHSRCSSSSGRRCLVPSLPPPPPQICLQRRERPGSLGASRTRRCHLGQPSHSLCRRRRTCSRQQTACSWLPPGRQHHSRSCCLFAAAAAQRPSLPPEQQPRLSSSTCHRHAIQHSCGIQPSSLPRADIVHGAMSSTARASPCYHALLMEHPDGPAHHCNTSHLCNASDTGGGQPPVAQQTPRTSEQQPGSSKRRKVLHCNNAHSNCPQYVCQIIELCVKQTTWTSEPLAAFAVRNDHVSTVYH